MLGAPMQFSGIMPWKGIFVILVRVSAVLLRPNNIVGYVGNYLVGVEAEGRQQGHDQFLPPNSYNSFERSHHALVIGSFGCAPPSMFVLAFRGLRGGGKKQKRNAKSTRHVLDELARTSLHTAAVRAKKTGGEDGKLPRIVRTGLLGHIYNPEEAVRGIVQGAGGVGSSAASYGRAAGEAGRQALLLAQQAKMQWQQVKAPVRKTFRFVIDGSNVLKHLGGKPQVGNMVGLVAAVEEQMKVSQSEILVIIDHWVAKELGQSGVAQLKAADYTLRIARPPISADVRIQQAAKAMSAYVISNDRYLDYCPWHTYNISRHPHPPKVRVQIGQEREQACEVPLRTHCNDRNVCLVSKPGTLVFLLYCYKSTDTDVPHPQNGRGAGATRTASTARMQQLQVL